MEGNEQPEAICYQPVGVMHSPFTELEGMPLQSAAAREIGGQLEIYPQFVCGLKDLDGFSHLHLVTHLHRGAPGGLQVVPFLDDAVRGIFATRSPRHPNPIGLSVVRLLSIAGPLLEVTGIDLLDGTPILDIKPYVPEFDSIAAERAGWLEHAAERVHRVRADGRLGDTPPDR